MKINILHVNSGLENTRFFVVKFLEKPVIFEAVQLNLGVSFRIITLSSFLFNIQLNLAITMSIRVSIKKFLYIAGTIIFYSHL